MAKSNNNNNNNNNGNCKLIVENTLGSDILGKPYLNSNSSLRTIDWKNTFSLLDDYKEKKTTTETATETTTWKVLKESSSSPEKLILIENLISSEECEQIIERCMLQRTQQMDKHYKVNLLNRYP